MATFPACDCTDLILDLVPALTCGENIGQIQRVVIQKIRPSTTPPFASVAQAQQLYRWIQYMDTFGDTKMVATPVVDSFVIPPAAAILEGGGGGNDTLNGMPIAHDGEPPRVEGMMRSATGAIRLALKKIQCVQTLDYPVVVFLFNDKGKVIGKTAADGTGFEGIPAFAFFTGDPGSEGKNQNDKTPISWSFPYGWADKIKHIALSDWTYRDLIPNAVS